MFLLTLSSWPIKESFTYMRKWCTFIVWLWKLLFVFHFKGLHHPGHWDELSLYYFSVILSLADDWNLGLIIFYCLDNGLQWAPCSGINANISTNMSTTPESTQTCPRVINTSINTHFSTNTNTYTVPISAATPIWALTLL